MGGGQAHFLGWFRWALLGPALACVLTAACAEHLVLTGSALLPPRLPLRAMPQVVVVHGEGETARLLARGLVDHLSEPGQTRAVLVRRAVLQRRGRLWWSQADSAMVELQLSAPLRRHHPYGSQGGTVCDSAGCFAVGAQGPLDAVSLERSLMVTVRFGARLATRDRAVVRGVVVGVSDTRLRARLLSQLAQRLHGLVDVQRRATSLPLADVRGAAAGLRLAEQGEYRRGADTFIREAQGLAWSSTVRSRLLQNAALCLSAVDEGTDVAALDRGIAILEALPASETVSASNEVTKAVLRAQKQAALRLRNQRRAAQRNFAGVSTR